MSKNERPISTQLPMADIIIGRASSERGRSRTYFDEEGAGPTAEGTLVECRLICMTESGFQDFVQGLTKPTMAAPELVDLLRRPAPWEGP